MTTRWSSKPVTKGVWERVGPRLYEHVTGLRVAYSHNQWMWEVIGGPDDGHMYSTLGNAQYAATRHHRA